MAYTASAQFALRSSHTSKSNLKSLKASLPLQQSDKTKMDNDESDGVTQRSPQQSHAEEALKSRECKADGLRVHAFRKGRQAENFAGSRGGKTVPAGRRPRNSSKTLRRQGQETMLSGNWASKPPEAHMMGRRRGQQMLGSRRGQQKKGSRRGQRV